MGRKKNRQYNPKPFEAVSKTQGSRFKTEQGEDMSDTFMRLYESMLLSPAYQALSYREKQLYTYCKAQYYGKRKPKLDADKEDELFYFSRKDAVRYGWCKQNDTGKLYEGMKILERFGFIEKVVSGKASHQKNIYRYSNRWQGLDAKTVGEIATMTKAERGGEKP